MPNRSCKGVLHRVFLDYILMQEGEPTCSNIHACLSNYGDIKNIADCLLHYIAPHATRRLLA